MVGAGLGELSELSSAAWSKDDLGTAAQCMLRPDDLARVGCFSLAMTV